MTRIDDVQDSRYAFRKYVKKHPDDKPSENELALWRKDPLRAKRFLESKGFVFNMTDEEFVKEHERLNLPFIERLKLSWKAQKAWWNGLSRRQRGFVSMGACFLVLGVVLFAMGILFITQFSPFLKQPKNYADPTVFKNTLDLVYSLTFIVVTGFFFVGAMFFWQFGSWFDIFYLESRVAFLERKIGVLEKQLQPKGEEKPVSRSK